MGWGSSSIYHGSGWTVCDYNPIRISHLTLSEKLSLYLEYTLSGGPVVYIMEVGGQYVIITSFRFVFSHLSFIII